MLGLLPRQRRERLHKAKTGTILISPYPENGGLMVDLCTTCRLEASIVEIKYCASGLVVPAETPRAAHVRLCSYVTSARANAECERRTPVVLAWTSFPGSQNKMRSRKASPCGTCRLLDSEGVRWGVCKDKTWRRSTTTYRQYDSVYLTAVPIRAPIRAPIRSRCTWYGGLVRLLGMRIGDLSVDTVINY